MRAVTDHDVKVAGDIGEMKADMRTVKHDLGAIQQGMIALGVKIDGVTNQQSKGLGFFAGAAFIVTTFGAALIVFAKLIGMAAIGGGHS